MIPEYMFHGILKQSVQLNGISRRFSAYLNALNSLKVGTIREE